MRKIYTDLLIVVIVLFMTWKHPILFLAIVATMLAIWFLALDDKKRKAIKDKIAEFYR